MRLGRIATLLRRMFLTHITNSRTVTVFAPNPQTAYNVNKIELFCHNTPTDVLNGIILDPFKNRMYDFPTVYQTNRLQIDKYCLYCGINF